MAERKAHAGIASAAALAVVVALAGLAVIALGLTRLDGADDYRDSTGEGVAFVQAAFQLVAGAGLAAVGAGGLWWASRRMGTDSRRTAEAGVWTIVGLVALAAVVAFVAESATR